MQKTINYQMEVGMSELSIVQSLESTQLAQRLADVEILCLLSFQSMTINYLTDSLRTTFGLSISLPAVGEILSQLEIDYAIEPIRKVGSPEPNISSDKVYAITTRGLKLLKEYIGSLSEIALTMQLGFNQKIISG